MTLPFEGLIDRIKADVTPHITTARDECNVFALRLLARLDTLIINTTDDEYIEHRRFVTMPLTADAAPVVLLQASPGEDWEMELVTVLDACTVTITESERFRYAKQFDTADCQPGVGLIIRENSAIHIASTGNAEPVKVSVQFKRKRDPFTRAAARAGQIEPGDDVMTRRGLTDPGTHAIAERPPLHPRQYSSEIPGDAVHHPGSAVQVTTPRTDEHVFG